MAVVIGGRGQHEAEKDAIKIAAENIEAYSKNSLESGHDALTAELQRTSIKVSSAHPG